MQKRIIQRNPVAQDSLCAGTAFEDGDDEDDVVLVEEEQQQVEII